LNITEREIKMTFPSGDCGAQFRWSFADAACQEALIKHQSAMGALKIVYDNDGLWDWGDPQGDGPELLYKMVDQYADAGAEAVVWGCGNNTGHGSAKRRVGTRQCAQSAGAGGFSSQSFYAEVRDGIVV
jgi:hypothetical protein